MDLDWWAPAQPARLNGHPFQLPPFDATIWTDALKKGWGGGKYQSISIGGHLSPKEAEYHINTLELRAAMLTLKAFLQNVSPLPHHIHLHMDNTTRSSPLMAQALELWSVVLEKQVWLTAKHIPGVENCDADLASRQIEFHTEWTLSGNDTDQMVFQRKLRQSCYPHDQMRHRNDIQALGEPGLTGVLNGIPVPFQLL